MDAIAACNREAERLLSLSVGKGPLDVTRQVIVDSTALYQLVSSQIEHSHGILEESLFVLIETICNLRSVVTNLERNNDTLESEVERLKNRIINLEYSEQTLIVGQIGHKVNNDILSYVMEGFSNRSIYTIRDMEKAIDKKTRFADAFHSEDERKTAEKRWMYLKSAIGWKDKHYRDIGDIKRIRLNSAHPEVSDEQFRDAVERVCYQNKYLRDVSFEFLKMLTAIREQ